MSGTITETATYSPSSHITTPSLQPVIIDTLVEVRTGRIQRLYSTPATSAIHKTSRKGPVRITELGCESDEHAFEKRGGPEKALLYYCSEHYLKWRVELPEHAHRFSVGGFGENLVSAKMNEENICIGDVIQIGSEVVISVTEPRMPCYKLNHRFEFKDMSRQTQEKSRTGWLYRVLKTGYIQAGDRIVLLQRPRPQWTIARVQKYLHKDQKNMEAMKELVELPELGQAIKGLFSNRLHQNVENELERLLGDETMALIAWSDYKVVEKRRETPRIYSFVLQAVNPAKIDHKILPGSHVRLKLPGKLMRAYSVVGGTIDCLEIGVGLESQSRGGSRYLHEAVKEGDILSASQIVPSFPLSTDADHHILIAGGIGVTAFVVAAEQLKQEGQSFKVHLTVRSAQEIPFRERLDKLSPNIVIHDKGGRTTTHPEHDPIKRLKSNTCLLLRTTTTNGRCDSRCKSQQHPICKRPFRSFSNRNIRRPFHGRNRKSRQDNRGRQ